MSARKCLRTRVWAYTCVVKHCLCKSTHCKYFSLKKNVDDFPYLGSLHPSKADTDSEIHHRISSASGVMPDSEEESLWTVTSRWRTACLQSSCSSHSSARGIHLDLQTSYRKQIDYLEHITRDGNLPPGRHTRRQLNMKYLTFTTVTVYCNACELCCLLQSDWPYHSG